MEREHHLYPYRGYGSREEIYLVGRVFRQKTTRQGGATGAQGQAELNYAYHLDAGLYARFLRRTGRWYLLAVALAWLALAWWLAARHASPASFEYQLF